MKKLLVITLVTLGSSLFTFCNGQYKTLLNFTDSSIYGPHPHGNVTLSGNKLYGMTCYGGMGVGTIFSIDTNGGGYKILREFAVTDGQNPQGSLVISQGVLYGMTRFGGATGNGCIFSVDTDGSGYVDLHDFNSTDTDGISPLGSLTISGNTLFGMTQIGGTNGEGIIFSIKTIGTNYKRLFNFNGALGEFPSGALTIAGHRLYGMTPGGGANNDGIVFSMDTSGIGFKDLLDFSGSNGEEPIGSLIISKKIMYGMTSAEGANNFGLVFSVDTNGNRFKDLLDFTGANGSEPQGDMSLSSANILYGIAFGGGSSDSGCIFSIDTNGANYHNLHNFTGLTGGCLSYGAATLSGKNLYGMTCFGGAYGKGTVFTFKDTNNHSSLGINQLITNEELIIYPNPSNGMFTVMDNGQLAIGNEGKYIEVYNTLGELVFSKLSTIHFPFSINLTNQPNGVYLYRLISNDGYLMGQGKLVIQK